MSVAFSSNDAESIRRKLYTSESEKRDESFSIDDVYEVTRCVDWIISNNFSKIALQFPDCLLEDSTYVALKLEEYTDRQIFILGDTSYGSCCVDEIAAEHSSADAIIHYGRACLNPSKRLPVLYIFGKLFVDIHHVINSFKRFFPNEESYAILLYEVPYSYAIGSIAKNLKGCGYENLVISELEIPNERSTSKTQISDNFIQISKCRRRIFIPRIHNINNYSAFYIGSQNATLTNFMLSFNNLKFYSYYPSKQHAQAETLDINKFLRKRHYYIEKAKDARIIGILVGTLGVSNYLSVIKYLQELIKEAGKKYYTVVVGKLNPAKLANFAEIEIFVNVACSESSLIECHEFYQPIIIPYELEIAFNQARHWTGDYITDFSEILPGAANHVPTNKTSTAEADVSLVTGKIRVTASSTSSNIESNLSSAITTRDEMKISAIHNQAAGEFLSQRSWRGLEQHLGETSISDIQQGKRGIACKYEDEENNENQ